MSSLPPLPPGFVLEDDEAATADMPPLPDGFELLSDEDEAPASFRDAQRKSASEDRGALAASTTTGAQGWSWGASDEIMAGVFTPLEMAIGAITGEDADKGLLDRARDAYARGLELQRMQIKEARENHPGAALAGEIAGGAVTTGTGMGAAKTVLGKMAVGAGEGVAAGGVSGFMSGEGLEDRLEKAETGAQIGAGVGAAFPLAGAAAGAVVRGAKTFVEPFTEAGREQIAARRLADGATDADALRTALDEGAEELVPGSAPTTFQATGDMGIGAMERVAQNRRPDLFMQRRADQNSARVGALEGVQPGGAPEEVANAIRQRFQMIDDETQAALDAARGAGDVMRRSVDEESQMALDSARTSADAARRGIDDETGSALDGATRAAQAEAGALGVGATPDVAGDQIRRAYTAAREKAKVQERALWKAVDPDGTLALGTQAAREQVVALRKELTPSSKPPSGEEAEIMDTIARYRETMPLADLQAMQSRLKDLMGEEKFARGQSAAYRRLTMLNGAIQRDLETAVVGKVAQEQAAVARGEMAQEDTLVARAQQWSDEWYARKAEAGSVLASGAGANASGGSVSVSGARGAAGEARGGYGDAPGDPRLPANDLAPNFDAGAFERLNAARGATRERAQTFDNDTLKPIARGKTADSPQMLPSAVPEAIFKSGAKGFDTIEVYRRAVGNDPQAMKAVSDFAVDRFLRVAGKADGTIDPAKARTWRNVHKDALRALPELDAQIMRTADASRAAADAAQFRASAMKDADRQAASSVREAERARELALRGAAKPTEAETAAEKGRAQALADADRGTLGKLRAETDRMEIAKLVGKAFDATASAQEMLKLKMAIGKEPAAHEGLKRAVVDDVVRRFVGTGEAGVSGIGTMKSDGFQQFVRKNKAALKSAGFDDEQIEIFERITADLQQSNRSNIALKNPGGSDTAQNTLSVQGKDGAISALGKVIAEQVADKSTRAVSAAGGVTFGATTGDMLGGAAIMGVGTAAQVVMAMRAAKLATVEDIVADALLHPDRARLLLSKATGKGETATMERLVRLYTNAATVAGTLEATDTPPEAVVPPAADRERADSPHLTPDDRASPIPVDLVDDGKKIMDGEAPDIAPAERGDRVGSAAPKSKMAELEERAKARRAARAAAA